jgi:antitoxin component of RelBE/YafQ-DinJ toxin-antitoxin module
MGSVIRARIDAELKDAVNAKLTEAGIKPSVAIRWLYEQINTNGVDAVLRPENNGVINDAQ